MKLFLKHNIYFISIYFILLLKIGYVLLNEGKVQIHKQINTLVGHQFFDIFFKYVTHIGDGAFSIALAIAMFFVNIKKSMYVLITYLFASLTSTIIKNYIYLDTCRPSFAFHFYVREPLKLVDGVEMHTFNSFPSGHSTAAFAVFISLMYMSKNYLVKILCLLIACLAAYSRTYLSQHWLVDIYFGSIIGFSYATLFYFVFYNKNTNSSLDNGIIAYFKNRKTVNV